MLLWWCILYVWTKVGSFFLKFVQNWRLGALKRSAWSFLGLMCKLNFPSHFQVCGIMGIILGFQILMGKVSTWAHIEYWIFFFNWKIPWRFTYCMRDPERQHWRLSKSEARDPGADCGLWPVSPVPLTPSTRDVWSDGIVVSRSQSSCDAD